VDAVLLASQAATANKARMMDNSAIPLILHQTWKNRRVDQWTDFLRNSVEKWLTHVVNDDMAYFFWEDEGIAQFLTEFEPDFVGSFLNLPASVERTDVFRILVVKWFGGIVRLSPRSYTLASLSLTYAFSMPTSTLNLYARPNHGSRLPMWKHGPIPSRKPTSHLQVRSA
jgi:hypothetical protein